MTTLAERIVYSRTQIARIEQADLAKACNVKPQAVSQWENGAIKELRAANLVRAARRMGVDAYWLATGEGTPTSATTVRDSRGRYDARLTAEEYRVVPKYDVQISAGPGRLNDHEQISAGLSFRKDWLASRNLNSAALVAVEVSGDSMLPRFHDGDTVLIDTTINTANDGGVYAIRLGDAVRIKRIIRRIDGTVILRSDNNTDPRYPDEVITQGQLHALDIIGRVVWVGGDV